MEALYSKLYDKYTKLKANKESEIDKINHDQEDKFMNYLSAADEFIDHLRIENNKLREKIDDLRGEVASVRSAKDEQHMENQRLLLEENQKNVKLAEEIERLQNLQGKGLCYSEKGDEGDFRQPSTRRSSLVETDVGNGMDVGVTKKRARVDDAGAELTTHASNQLECFPIRESEYDISKQSVPTRGLINTDQPECCRRKLDLSGSANDTGPVHCMFQDLVECLLGMKVQTVSQSDGTSVSAVHQSSGYSFSLTWVDKAGGDEVVYRVLSLGTFERVAPEWMREVLKFSTRMCPLFFERISHVIKLHQ